MTCIVGQRTGIFLRGTRCWTLRRVAFAIVQLHLGKAKPAVDMVAIRGGGGSGGRHVCLPSPSWPSPVALVVRMSYVCVTASFCHMAPSACRSWRCVSLLYLLFATEARESISLFGVILRRVCGRDVFAGVVWRVCGVASYLGLFVAVRKQGESR